MEENKMHLISKIFNNETIRTVWDKESEKYYISVVDVVGVLSESSNPQTYWRVMKKRLKDEGNETVTNCNALKLKAQDGKYRMTDVVDIEGMFRIIKSIRDNIDRLEVILTDLSEETTKRLAEKHRPQGLSQIKK